MSIQTTYEVPTMGPPVAITEQNNAVETSALLDGSGRLKVSRLEELDEKKKLGDSGLGINTPQFVGQKSLSTTVALDFEIAQWPTTAEPKRQNILKRAWGRANLLYATAPKAAINKVSRFFTKEGQAGETSIRKGRLALAAAGLAVAAAGVSYVKYKHGLVSGDQQGGKQHLADQIHQAIQPSYRPKSKSGQLHQHLNAVTPARPKNSFNILAGDQPWNVLERHGVQSNQINQQLTQAAQKLQAQTGNSFAWHGSGSQAYIEVAGKTDTKSVMSILAPYL